MSTKHIYWFAYFNTDEPSVRYRGKYALENLNKRYGISYDLIFPGYGLVNIYRFVKACFSILFNRKTGSVIVFEKIHTRRIYATTLKILLRLQPDNTLYDIDDADYLKFPPDNIYHFIKNCAKCSVGSNVLADVARKMNDNVFLLTSPVIDHPYVKTKRNSCFTIGWVGYYNAHRESLMQLFFPSLKNLSSPVTLVLLGVTKPEHFVEIKNIFKDAANVILDLPQAIDWHDEDSLYQKIATFDIGVAPLLDTEINRAKSAFKLKQYLSCGVPVLGSGMGENSLFLRHGNNGYVCNNWNDYMFYVNHVMAITDHEYAELSANARGSKSQFSIDQYCELLLENISIQGEFAYPMY